jgi:hypothetical protein
MATLLAVRTIVARELDRIRKCGNSDTFRREVILHFSLFFSLPCNEFDHGANEHLLVFAHSGRIQQPWRRAVRRKVRGNGDWEKGASPENTSPRRIPVTIV